MEEEKSEAIPDLPDQPEGSKQPDQSGTPDASTIPSAGVLAGADEEKAAMVEQAKSRVAAVKESLADKPSEPAGATAAPKAPVKKKDEGPKPIDASNNPLVVTLKGRFGDAIVEAVEFIGQLSVRVDKARIVEVCDFLKRHPESPFNYLSDLTCVHLPDRSEAPFEVVYNLYSIPANERVRLNVAVNGGGVESVTGVWPSANWLERR